MNDPRHPLDDLFKNKLESYSMDIPEGVWEKISQNRKPKAGLFARFKGGLIIATLASVSAVAIGINLMLNTENSNNTPIIALNQSPANSIINHNNTPKSISDDQNNTSGNSNHQEIENLSPAGPGGTPEKNKGKIGVGSDDPKPSGEEQNFPIRPKNEVKSQNPEKDKKETPDSKSESKDIFTPENKEDNKNLNTEKTTPITENSDNSENNNNSENVEPAIVKDDTEKSELVAKDNTDAIDNTDGTEESNKTTHKKEASKFSIELASSYDWVSRSIQGQNGFNPNNYRSFRNDADLYNGSFSLALRVNREINEVFTLSSGIQLSQINERTSGSVSEQVQQINERKVNGFIVDPFGNQIPVTYTFYDTVNVTQTRNINSSNRMTFIDVPIFIRYNFFMSNKLSLSLNPGLLVNLGFRQRGSFLNPNDLETHNLNRSNNPYRPSAGVTASLGLGLHYKINNQFGLIVEPTYRLGLESVTSSNFAISQQFRTLSTFVGVRYNF